jgi:hypothetical protein
VLSGYLDELVARLRDRLGARLVGAWLFGSGALGDFDPARSDVDVQAVASERLEAHERLALAAALEDVPCPVRGLEFVLYAADDLDELTPQLNLNSGPRMDHRLDLDVGDDEWFWFTIDVAIGRRYGRALAGPPARDVFPVVGDERIAAALRAALAWPAPGDPTAARAWAWAVERRWLTKSGAERWAAARLGSRAPLTRADRQRVAEAAATALAR